MEPAGADGSLLERGSADGRQQFVNIYIEGDFPDLSALDLPTVDTDLLIFA